MIKNFFGGQGMDQARVEPGTDNFAELQLALREPRRTLTARVRARRLYEMGEFAAAARLLVEPGDAGRNYATLDPSEPSASLV